MKLPLLLISLANSATHYPNDVAIVIENQAWTYKQLWVRVQQFEDAVVGLALPYQVSIAVVAHKSVETLALMLAIGKKGHTTLSVSPALGDAVKPNMFASAGVYCELRGEWRHGVPLITVSTACKEQAQAVPIGEVADTCPLMLTTSGSTGVPKVVKLSAEGVRAFFNWGIEYFQLVRGSRVLSYAPLNFDLSLLEVWAPLAVGATVILSDTARATQADYLLTLIHESRPDLVQAVPMFYALLCQDQSNGKPLIEPVRHVVFTGDTTSQRLRQQVAAAFPHTIFHNVYGCTETNDSFVYTTTAQEVARHDRLPLGCPITGVDYRIVVDDGSELIGSGEGELHTSTPFLAHGYTDPSQTAKVFYSTAGSNRIYYRTGDRVARDEHGQLTLLGRNDFIVKVRGVRTNLQDIEQTLAKMPIVKNAVVIPVNDEIAGVVLHAVVEPTQGQKLDGMALRILCAQSLPQTSVPRRFHLHEGPLPVTSTGKPDRTAIALSIQPQGTKPA